MASYNVTVSAYLAGAPYLSTDTVTLADTGANIAALSAVNVGNLATSGVDKINASDDTLALTVAQYQALGTVTLATGDIVTLADTDTNLAALTATAIAALADAGIDKIDASDNSLALTVAQYQALGTVALTSADTVTLTGTGASLSALTATQIGALAAAGIDQLDATDNVLSLTLAQYQALGTVTVAANDTLTLSGTGASIGALSVSAIAGLAAAGFDKINATDDVLSLTVAQFQALGTVQLAAGDVITLADTGANIAALSSTAIAALADAGIDKIDATDNTLSLSLSQLQALGTVTLATADTVNLADSSATIEALSTGTLAGLAALGVDTIDTTDNVLSLTVAKAQALGSVTLAAADTVTLADTGAHISALSASALAALVTAGIDVIDASDNSLALTVAQWHGIAGASLAGSDSVSIIDTGANLATLSTTDMANLGTAGVHVLVSNAGDVALTVDQGQAMIAHSIWLDDSYGVLTDTGAAIDALDAATLFNLADLGVYKLDATDNVLVFDTAQMLMIETHFDLTPADDVTLADSGANLAGLGAGVLSDLADMGVDHIDATDNMLTLTVAQAEALGAITLTAADTVTLQDSSAALSMLSAGQLAALVESGIDGIKSTDESLTLTLSQAMALAGAHVDEGATLVVSDGGFLFSDLTVEDLATLNAIGVDSFDGLGMPLELTVAQYHALDQITLTDESFAVLYDTASALGALSVEDISGLSGAKVDLIVAWDGGLSLSLAQLSAFGPVGVLAFDGLTLADSGAVISALSVSDIQLLAYMEVGAIDATDDAYSLTFDQFTALDDFLSLAPDDTVTVTLTAEQAASLAGSDFSTMAMHGVDVVAGADGTLVLTLDQLEGMGDLMLVGSDSVTLQLDAAALSGIPPVGLAALVSYGIDFFDTGSTYAALSLDQVATLGVGVVDDHRIVLTDLGASLALLPTTAFAGLAETGVGAIDASNGVLALSVAQNQAVESAEILLTPSDLITLTDSGANLAALSASEMALLASNGIDALDATDNALTLTPDQLAALDGVMLANSDTVVLAASSEVLAALTPSDLAAMADKGVDRLDATDDTLALDLDQFIGLSGMQLTSADDVTVLATAAQLSDASPALIAALAHANVDTLAVDGGTIALSAAQAAQLGSLQLSGAEAVVLHDSGAAIAALSADDIAGLSGAGVTALDLTTASITLNAVKYEALGGLTFAAATKVTLLSNHSLTMGDDVDNVSLTGTKNLVVTGNSGANVITGNAGNNILYGGAGNDRLIGGAGRDVMTGGAGTDKFIFRDGDFGGKTASTADRITDFSHGSGDLISLIGVDANTNTGSDDAFTWIGTSGFHQVAGELRYTQVNGNTYVQGDTNGDGRADFWIRLDGTMTLHDTDFQL